MPLRGFTPLPLSFALPATIYIYMHVVYTYNIVRITDTYVGKQKQHLTFSKRFPVLTSGQWINNTTNFFVTLHLNLSCCVCCVCALMQWAIQLSLTQNNRSGGHPNTFNTQPTGWTPLFKITHYHRGIFEQGRPSADCRLVMCLEN